VAVGGVASANDAGWGYYGGNEGGLRYSEAGQITTQNVDDLIPAWTYSTGDIASRDPKAMRRTKLEVTPILVGGKLLVCTPFNEVIALNPATGEQGWRFDPKIPTEKVFPANKFNCRGVASWSDARVNIKSPRLPSSSVTW
jgi:quinoprotein glucose dehydrogenase